MISFKSKIAKKVLTYFLLNPESELYLNEISRKFNVDRGNLARKLSEWEKIGIIIKGKRGNLSLYKVNKLYPLLNEIKSIAQKNFGLEEQLKKVLLNLKGLEEVIVFGSYARGDMEAESDIDLLLIGSHDSFEAQRNILSVQKELGREINTIDMTRQEFEKKKKEDFIRDIFNKKFIKVI